MTQEEALTILKTGANVFLTGEPGSGKTHTINQYVAWLRARGVEPAITASTGIAATHIGGMTIHAWSGIGIKRELTDWDIEMMLEREPLVRRVRSCQVLIIDEVSMMDAQLLDMVDQAVRGVKQSSRPFGGLQVIFVGDFFQLPPVSPRDAERSGGRSKFAYSAGAWERANPIVCYLHEQHRQEDGAFLELLSALRANEVTDEHVSILRGRAKAPTGGIATQLYPHNADVDRINIEALAKIEGELHTYRMQSQGSKALLEALVRGCLSPQELTVKVGAVVMFTRNNFEAGYVNGTLGTITGWSINGSPMVKTRGGLPAGKAGKIIEASPEEWRVEDGKRILAKIVQVPLRLAWAMTVHKSQGMSLDSAVMDLSQSFEYGQGYVALSRVRTLEGLYLMGFNRQALTVHPEVLEKDQSFRTESAQAGRVFGAMPAQEYSELQKNFLKAVGGREPAEVAKEAAKTMGEASSLEKMRQKHPNAYKPWSAEDDARLTEMFQGEAKVPELVKEFGRQRGAINSRLVRLGLVEPDL